MSKVIFQEIFSPLGFTTTKPDTKKDVPGTQCRRWFARLTLVWLSTIFGASSAQAFVIDFAVLGDSPLFFTEPIDMKYATFAAVEGPGYTNPILEYLPATPHYPSSEICPLDEFNYCTGFMEVEFYKPVNSLSFWAYGLENEDYVDIYVYGQDGFIDLVSPLDLIPDTGSGPIELDPDAQFVDLSRYANVTRLFMEVGDLAGGVSFNLFAAEVPAPGTLAILSLGFAGLILARRSSQKANPAWQQAA